MTTYWTNLRPEGVIRQSGPGGVRKRDSRVGTPKWRTESGEPDDPASMTDEAREAVIEWVEHAVVPPDGTEVKNAEGEVVGTIGEDFDALNAWVWRHDGHEWIRAGRVSEVAAGIVDYFVGAPAHRPRDPEREKVARRVREAYQYVSDEHPTLGEMARVDAAAWLVERDHGHHVSKSKAWRMIRDQ